MLRFILLALFVLLAPGTALAQESNPAVDLLAAIEPWLVVAWPYVELVLQAVGGLVVVASAWVKFTPSKEDDEVVGTIRTWLDRFSLFADQVKPNPGGGAGIRVAGDDE